MKIGIVCPYNIFAGGGVQECVFAQRDELKKLGHSVKIITPLPGKKNRKDIVPEDVVFIGNAAKIKSFHTTSQISASADSEQIESLLQTEQFDVLHFHEPWVPLLGRQILSRSNSINVATFHAKLPDSRVNHTIEKVITPYTKSILKYLDSITAVSDAAADYIRTLTAQNIEIIPNGIDLHKYTHHKRHSLKRTGLKRIVYVGRLERRKGVKYLLDAAAHIQSERDDIVFDIVGAGPDERRLKSYTHTLKLNNVVFHGYVDDAEKISLMQSADVFCSPALYGESFGIVLLESMALGVPLVAGANPGYISVMKERGSISIMNPKDTARFASRLCLFIDDEELRALWTDWATQYVQQFEYKKVIHSYHKMYKSLKAR